MAAIASLFDETQLVVCERRAPTAGVGTPLPSVGVRVVPLREPHGRDGRRKLFLIGSSGYYLARLAGHVARADAVHAVLPGDIGMFGMMLAMAMRKRLFVRYCSSWPDRPETTGANRLCKRLMVRHAGGRNVMFATGMGSSPPDGPGGHLRWIFATSLRAADLQTVEAISAHRQPVRGLCRLLYIGRFTEGKGLLNLLEAMARLQTWPGLPSCCLTLAGHGPQQAELQKRTAALGLQERVRFTGLLDRTGVLQELAAADLFVLPSMNEGFPKALVEAMVAGVPAVASGVGAIPPMLEGGHGRVVPPGDIDALTKELASLAMDGGQRAEIGRRARRRAWGWTLETWAEQIGAALEEAWHVPLKGAMDARHKVRGRQPS